MPPSSQAFACKLVTAMVAFALCSMSLLVAAVSTTCSGGRMSSCFRHDLRRFMKSMMEMLGNFISADDGSDEEVILADVGTDDVDDDDDDSHGSTSIGGSDHGEDGRRHRHRGHRPRGHVKDSDMVPTGGGLGQPPPLAPGGGRKALRHRQRVASPTTPRELLVEIAEQLPLPIAEVSRAHRPECQHLSTDRRGSNSYRDRVTCRHCLAMISSSPK